MKVLFLCTGNSCRSQMAEGWARALHPGPIEPFSAGTAGEPDEEAALAHYRRVRDEIRDYVERIPGLIAR